MTAAPALPGVVVGLAAEERLLRRAWDDGGALAIRCAGASGERAERLARALVEAGASGLASVGLAGGLDPALGSGALLLCDSVVLPNGGSIAADTPWRQRLARRLGAELPHLSGSLMGSNGPAVSAAEKAFLRARSGAAAVDMETHGVARAAVAAGVPLLVMRVIADPAGQGVPSAALAGLAPDGGVSVLLVLRALARRPGQVPEMVRLARQSAAAMAVLGRAVRLAGPTLGLA